MVHSVYHMQHLTAKHAVSHNNTVTCRMTLGKQSSKVTPTNLVYSHSQEDASSLHIHRAMVVHHNVHHNLAVNSDL